jgi:hypothetical protein
LASSDLAYSDVKSTAFFCQSDAEQAPVLPANSFESQDDTLWIDQTGDLYAGKIPEKVLELDEEKIDWLSGRVFNIQKHGDTWYWQRRSDHRLQLLQKKANQSPKVIVTTDSYHFNVSKAGVYYHQSPPQNIDIYRTVMMQ